VLVLSNKGISGWWDRSRALFFKESSHGIHFGDLGPGDKGDINVDDKEVV